MLSTEDRLARVPEEAERKARYERMRQRFAPTGEIVGETEWRRWRVGESPNTQWHAKTPASILEHWAWLFDDSLEMPTGLPNA